MDMLVRDGLVFLEGAYARKDIRVSEGLFLQIEEPGVLGAAEGEEVLEAFGKKILPGLVDIHTHGRAGEDFSFADEEVLKKLCASYAASGVTAVLATTMTNEPETMKRSMAAIAAFCENRTKEEADGARLFGIHAEGPFLGEKKKGAHDARYLWKAEPENYEALADACDGWLRLLAVDPELEGAEKLVHRCNEDGVTVSLAHTACGYDTACKAAEWGADHVTHLFNAMQPLHHREPGLIGAAVDKGMYVELICDGIHLHPAIIRMMFALCPEKVLLISDSMQAAGLSDGEYELGGIKVYVKDGKATLQYQKNFVSSLHNAVELIMKQMMLNNNDHRVAFIKEPKDEIDEKLSCEYYKAATELLGLREPMVMTEIHRYYSGNLYEYRFTVMESADNIETALYNFASANAEIEMRYYPDYGVIRVYFEINYPVTLKNSGGREFYSYSQYMEMLSEAYAENGYSASYADQTLMLMRPIRGINTTYPVLRYYLGFEDTDGAVRYAEIEVSLKG